jgi:general secretion pathway protein C
LDIQLEKLLNRVLGPAKWMIVFAIAWTIANSVLNLMAPHTSQNSITTQTSSGTSTNRAEQARTKQQRIESLISNQLFGSAETTKKNSAARIEKTTATRLPLTLNAVFIANDNIGSGAIVTQSGKKSALYTVGDNLPGNAQLIEVYQEEVILLRAGRREALAFQKTKFAPVEGIQRLVNANPIPRKRTVENIDDIEKFTGTSGEDTIAALGLETNAGEGYKIRDLSKSPYLQQAGLRAGDIVLSINGQSLGDMKRDRLEFNNILALDSASIKLQRNGEQMTITAKIPNFN